LHVAAMVLGGLLLCTARQPIWLEQVGRRLWFLARQQGLAGQGRGALLIGVLWSLMPCGLLYSAVLVAALSGDVLSGAGVMALFALGSGVSMLAGPTLWRHMRASATGDWGVRLAGLLLFGSSGAALWMGLMHDNAPWCLTP
jgi:sulfite exporter TauE/SafE